MPAASTGKGKLPKSPSLLFDILVRAYVHAHDAHGPSGKPWCALKWHHLTCAMRSLRRTRSAPKPSCSPLASPLLVNPETAPQQPSQARCSMQVRCCIGPAWQHIGLSICPCWPALLPLLPLLEPVHLRLALPMHACSVPTCRLKWLQQLTRVPVPEGRPRRHGRRCRCRVSAGT